MSKLSTYQKRAKQIVRWHRARDHSVGGTLRLLPRLRHLTDVELLDMPLPLALAQEAVAAAEGFADWAALKASTDGMAAPAASPPALRLGSAVPVLFVRDVTAAADHYVERLGFTVDFLHGAPAFYGSISRDEARLHLRFVHAPNFRELAAREESLIVAAIEVRNVKQLFAQYSASGADIVQPLVQHPWGGLDFIVRDIDGNCIAFVEQRG